MEKKRFGRNLEFEESAGLEKEELVFVSKKSPKAIKDLEFLSTIREFIRAEFAITLDELQ